MVISRTANQPITFPGQIVEYAHDGTSTSGIITSTENTPVKFTKAKRMYTTTGGNPSPYVPG